MPASVLIDRPTPEATCSLTSAGIGPVEIAPPPSAVHQQLANFARSTTNANVSEYSSQGKQQAFGPIGAGSSPVLGRCGPSVIMPHQGPSSAAGITNRKSMNMTECVHVASSEHVAEIVGRQGKFTQLLLILIVLQVKWLDKSKSTVIPFILPVKHGIGFLH